jgi:hypothetical protein
MYVCMYTRMYVCMYVCMIQYLVRFYVFENWHRLAPASFVLKIFLIFFSPDTCTHQKMKYTHTNHTCVCAHARSVTHSLSLHVCMYVYVCMYVFMYACMHLCVCVCVCVCVYLYIPNRDAAALAEKVAKKAAASGGE